MREGNTLVFVGVRLRSARTFGSAAESIDARKQQRLIRAGKHY
jgi:putative endonuclease